MTDVLTEEMQRKEMGGNNTVFSFPRVIKYLDKDNLRGERVFFQFIVMGYRPL